MIHHPSCPARHDDGACACPAGVVTPPPIRRMDRYTITVADYRVRATHDQEARIRQMDTAQQARFLTIMGRNRG